MADPELIIHLYPGLFSDRNKRILDFRSFKVDAFKFESGVLGLRFESEIGELILLPYQGQQIWSAKFRGRELKMRSIFDTPNLTADYLSNYGGFLIHCGATAIGAPGRMDTHPLHGELPNAPFQKAYIFNGHNQNGNYIGLGGEYVHKVAFKCNYKFEPRIKFYEESSVIEVNIDIENLSKSQLELMYLGHINFKPYDNSRLVYSAHATPKNVRVRKDTPRNIRIKPGLTEFLQELANNPEKHHYLAPELVYDPEIVFYIQYESDEDGWAHSLQIHPDGSSDYVSHRPDQLKIGVRWICRTPDQDALGLVLPGTAEVEGYSAAKEKGYILSVNPQEKFSCQYKVGALLPGATQKIEQLIQKILTIAK